MDYRRKMICRSGYWYNDGLRKAQIRDMSGAVLSLRRSLQYQKDNIDARNLLGLVYYGRGEVAEALVEWIISKNIRPEGNIANGYIKNIQDSAAELETIDQAVKKYNQSLIYCRQKGEDLAVIQLKKVIAMHPSFLKAYQLLALLYLYTEQYAKARQVLREARRLDTANELTLRYIQELNQLREKKVWKDKKTKKTNEEVVEYSVGNETIIQPKNETVRVVSGKMTILNILVGILIGTAVIWFLVMPGMEGAEDSRMNGQMIEYSQRIRSLESQISALTRALDGYRATDADSAAAVKNAAAAQESYEKLAEALKLEESQESGAAEVMEALSGVDRDLLGPNAQEVYDSLSEEIAPEVCQAEYLAGLTAYGAEDYTGAVGHFQRVVDMDKSYENGNALLNLALSYIGAGDDESARECLQQVVQLFAGTEIAQTAQDRLDLLSQ